MPNHCENNSIIEGPEADIKRFWEAVQGEEDTLCFVNLVPMPEDETDWYSWCNDNWGTKWGDYEHQGEITYGEWEEKRIESSYITAWGPLSVEFWLKVSTMFPTLRIAVSYDEPGMDFSGWHSFYGGEHVGEYQTKYTNLMDNAIGSLRDHCQAIQEAEIMGELPEELTAHIETDEEYGRRVSALLEKEGGVS